MNENFEVVRASSAWNENILKENIKERGKSSIAIPLAKFCHRKSARFSCSQKQVNFIIRLQGNEGGHVQLVTRLFQIDPLNHYSIRESLFVS